MREEDISGTLVSFITVAATLGALYFLFRPEVKCLKERDLPTEGGLGLSDDEKEMFIPSSDWQPVSDRHICPPGLEFRMNLSDGSKFARLPQ